MFIVIVEYLLVVPMFPFALQFPYWLNRTIKVTLKHFVGDDNKNLSWGGTADIEISYLQQFK